MQCTFSAFMKVCNYPEMCKNGPDSALLSIYIFLVPISAVECPHFTRNWVSMKDILGPHANWEQRLLRVCTEDCEFRKYFLSLKSNAGSVCKKTRIFVNQNSWFLLATLCFWSLGFTFLFTIFELELLIDENHRAKINIISDIEKLLKWLPVV